MRQRTIAREAVIEGVGLHTGSPCRLTLRPAPPGEGIVFRRVDLAGSPPVRASLASVSGTDRGVTLRFPFAEPATSGSSPQGRSLRPAQGRRVQDGAPVLVATVEHLLSVAFGLGIDNLIVDVDGEELPAGDGSAMVYVEAMRAAGVVELEAPRLRMNLEQAVWARDDAGCVVAIPSSRMQVRYVVVLPALGVQMATFDASTDRFEEAIAPARTWGFVEEAEGLRQKGLALGASEENVLVLSQQGYVTPPRFPDEPARHKILDLLGDLALMEREFVGEVIAISAGHGLHISLARKIVERLSR